MNHSLGQGFVVQKIADILGFPLIALQKGEDASRPTVYLSSGIHGDEPAAPMAMSELLKSGFFANQANWRICPILNPIGLDLGQRENANGIDLNRDFRVPKTTEVIAYTNWISKQPNPDLSIALHEDWESTGFYMYQIRPTVSENLFAPRILRTVAKLGPIESSTEIDGHAAAGGLIEPYASKLEIDKTEIWSEADYQCHRHPHWHFTFETPSCLSLELRIRMQIRAVKEAMRILPSVSRLSSIKD
ncbi:MAG: M14 family metallocarboxypeptidase [Verrucomicrobiota bacterium]